MKVGIVVYSTTQMDKQDAFVEVDLLADIEIKDEESYASAISEKEAKIRVVLGYPDTVMIAIVMDRNHPHYGKALAVQCRRSKVCRSLLVTSMELFVH